jgi:hypothetical protein
MSYRIIFLWVVFVSMANYAVAQKPFTEGTVVYKVKLESEDHKVFSGVYTFTIKGSEIRKELKLNNGYQDIVLLDCGAGTVYSLQNRDGKKYAIQLKMSDLVEKQEKFKGYLVKNEAANQKNIAGYAVYKGDVNYKDGSQAEVYYSKDWRPAQGITFERFPDANFLPMRFSYEDENKMTMEFEVEKVDASPIENAVFRIPPDSRMISYKEYKELSK